MELPISLRISELGEIGSWDGEGLGITSWGIAGLEESLEITGLGGGGLWVMGFKVGIGDWEEGETSVLGGFHPRTEGPGWVELGESAGFELPGRR